MVTILLSQTIPPNRSGSSHIVKELLAGATSEDHLVVLGGRSPFARRAQRQPRTPFTFPSELFFFGRGARFFTAVRGLLFPFLVLWIRFHIHRQHAKKVVCIFPDELYCIAASWAVAGTKASLEYWFHNTYAPNRRRLLGLIARRMEPLMIRRAAKVHCLTDALRKVYIDAYSESAHKITTTHHPAGEPLATHPEIEARTVFRCLLIGNINQSNLDATSRIFAAIRDIPGVKVLVATQVPIALLRWRGLSLQNGEYLGYLTDESLEQTARSADVLLLPHGLRGTYAPEEYDTIFPTRATYYFRLGKPIFSLCPEGSFLARFLTEHNCAKVCTSPDVGRIRADFSDLLQDAASRRSIAKNALATAGLFSTRHVIKELTR